MNLYKERFVHYSPKDFKCGIHKYFIAENDKECYHKVYGKDADSIFGEGSFFFDGESIESKRQEIIEVKGEMNLDYEVQDAYYGVTVKGWELVKEDLSEDDIVYLKRMNIIETKGE